MAKIIDFATREIISSETKKNESRKMEFLRLLYNLSQVPQDDEIEPISAPEKKRQIRESVTLELDMAQADAAILAIDSIEEWFCELFRCDLYEDFTIEQIRYILDCYLNYLTKSP